MSSLVEVAKTALSAYSTCDISDALCAFAATALAKEGGAGGVGDSGVDETLFNHCVLDVVQVQSGTSTSYSPGSNHTNNNSAPLQKHCVFGLAYTAEFTSTSTIVAEKPPNHVDTCPPGAVLVIKTPANAPNAVWGGLMTARAVAVGCVGVITDGRVRDVAEIKEGGLPVWSKGTSTMGAAPYCKLAKVGHDILLNASSAHPVPVKCGKTLIVGDDNGVIAFDLDLVLQIAAYCEKRVAVDALCMEDLKAGHSISETFAKHRGK